MQGANIYLNFDGNCRKAMTFYGECLQAKPDFTPFSPEPTETLSHGAAAPERILHSELASGPVVLMASDTLPEATFQQGNNFSISIRCDNEAELQRLFTALAENGNVTAPLHDAFWGGRFGMLTDQFGIGWMLSFRASQ